MLSVCGIDPSLQSTGLARFDFDRDGNLHSCPTKLIKTKGSFTNTLLERRGRMEGIVGQFAQFAAGCSLIVIEGPSFGSQGAGTHDRSGLWWQLAMAAMDIATVIEVTPSQRMKYITGKGSGKDKDEVMAAAIRTYPWAEISNNNVADAVIFADIAARILGLETGPRLTVAMKQVLETLVST